MIPVGMMAGSPATGSQNRPTTPHDMDEAEVVDRIRRDQGQRLWIGRMVLLGHHYQRREIVDMADFKRGFTGTLQGGQRRQDEAEFIVFCGVRFMVESARVLARPDQKVSTTPTSAPAAPWPTWRTATLVENGVGRPREARARARAPSRSRT